MLKNFILFSLFSLFISSCTVIVPAVIWTTQKKVSHDDVMNSYKTKKDVIKNFGIPTSKISVEGIEIWTYKAGSSDNNKIIEGTIEFQFENGNEVSSWRTEEHENYGNINERTKKTYFGYLIGGTIDLIILLIIGISSA